MAIPRLYKSLVISASAGSLESVDANFHAIPSKYQKYAREFGFHASPHEQAEYSKVHANVEQLKPPCQRENENDNPFSSLHRALEFRRFEKNQLRSFRWEVGVCVPKNVFCGRNSLLGNQKSIQSVSLSTGDICGVYKKGQFTVELVPFKELRSLDWKGMVRYTDFESFKACIQAHGHQLQSLTLDICDWNAAMAYWDSGYKHWHHQYPGFPTNFFLERVLNLHPGDRKVLFGSLENLQLSDISFHHSEIEMAYAFNIESLKCLKLENCHGSHFWLRTILNHRDPMNLKSLELQFDHSAIYQEEEDGPIRGAEFPEYTESIWDFVHYVSGLESLYLLLPAVFKFDWATLAEKLSGNCHLKRLVLHTLVEEYDTDHSEYSNEDEFNAEYDGPWSLVDGDIPWSLPLERLLQGNQLTFFGSSIRPSDLVSFDHQPQKLNMTADREPPPRPAASKRCIPGHHANLSTLG